MRSKNFTTNPIWLALFVTLAAASAPALAVGPWASNPVVFGQEVGGVVDADYSSAWTHWKDLGYAPVSVSGVEKSGSPVRYSGLWHKDPSIVAWTSRRGLTATAYQDLWDQLIAQHFRVLDLDAHVVGGQALYDVIFVKDATFKPFYSHRILTRAQLDAKVALYSSQGYRPIRINAYKVGSQVYYAAVWVQDGLTDAPLLRDLTSTQYGDWWTLYKNQGYHPVDIAVYVKDGGQRYAGIWVRGEAGIDNWISLRDRTAAQMQAEIIAQKKANYLEIDLDAYYTTGGSLRFSGVWIRRQPRNVLTGNVTLSGAQIDSLKSKLSEYVNLGTDARKGSVGFYIEDLTNGHWIAFNPNEPFYLASAAKTFIAAKTVSMPEMPSGDLYQLRTSDWRGEATRGFTKSDIGDDFPVSTYLDHMIDNSDSCSTDRLSGLIASFDGALAVNKFLDDQAAMQNVGEITTICQVDKRVQANADPCVFSVPCNSFESWGRANDTSYSTAADKACFSKV
ncbi:MAG TPA: serine hydrolase, partial [Thermoanaerobaculia bacterium]|nr:serine hydrolase [Thermoanaerobaculia bacterium]